MSNVISHLLPKIQPAIANSQFTFRAHKVHLNPIRTDVPVEVSNMGNNNPNSFKLTYPHTISVSDLQDEILKAILLRNFPLEKTILRIVMNSANDDEKGVVKCITELLTADDWSLLIANDMFKGEISLDDVDLIISSYIDQYTSITCSHIAEIVSNLFGSSNASYLKTFILSSILVAKLNVTFYETPLKAVRTSLNHFNLDDAGPGPTYIDPDYDLTLRNKK